MNCAPLYERATGKRDPISETSEKKPSYAYCPRCEAVTAAEYRSTDR